LNILRGSVDVFIKKVEAKDKEREQKLESDTKNMEADTKIMEDSATLKTSGSMPSEVYICMFIYIHVYISTSRYVYINELLYVHKYENAHIYVRCENKLINYKIKLIS
jgi:hypothetical protein